MNTIGQMKMSFRFISLSCLFVACLIVANIIVVKQVDILGLTLPAAVVIFPISYILGDVLTEVYGYRITRRVIWLGFACNLVVVVAVWIAGQLPSADVFTAQRAYEQILGTTPRFLAASFLAYLTGEFANSFIMSKLKVSSKGRFLWFRTISSTLVGQGLDTVIVLTVAFFGVLPGSVLGLMILSHWLVKVLYEVLATPFTYLLVGYLKDKEGTDAYDRGVSFNPLEIN